MLKTAGYSRGWKGLVPLFAVLCFQFSTFSLNAQAPGTAPVTVSFETQMLHGRKYYVHIVEKGQTVYSIAKAYKVESYDAVTHVDIHFMHPGDTVWLPCRGQFPAQPQAAESEVVRQVQAAELKSDPPAGYVRPATSTSRPLPTSRPAVSARQASSQPQTAPPEVRKPGKVLKVALLMPLHLDKMDEISTSKFDIEQRGKRSYRQFEFIEFYEGVRMALDKLADEGGSVELNVVDIPDNNPVHVNEAFASHQVEQSDMVIALLLRDAFDRAAELARQAGIYIVNPMTARSELCRENPYMVKMQPSLACMVSTMLQEMKTVRPAGQLCIIHSGAKAEKPVMEEVKRQLDERGDIKYTLFNWSQNAKLVQVLKGMPECSVLSLYDQGRDVNRVYVNNLLNRLSSIKSRTPVLYSLTDWTREYGDIDFNQLQLLGYHTYTAAWDMTNEVHVGFLQDFRHRYGTEPTSQLAAIGYDLMLYIGRGLHRRGADFWTAPGAGVIGLTQPMRLVRNGAGLENDRAVLYKMEGMRLLPALENK